MKHYFKIALATLAIASLSVTATDKSVMLNDDKVLSIAQESNLLAAHHPTTTHDFKLSAEGQKAQATTSKANAAAQANNPLANMTALNFQNYYMGRLSEVDEDANQFVLRYAKPFKIGDGLWLLRLSLPFNSFPAGADLQKDHGFGDVNAFAAYLFDTGDPALSFGFGPQVTIPTASKGSLGSEKWSAGFANVLFNAQSKIFQYGYLLTWQQSFGGDAIGNDQTRDDVNFLAFQPFAFVQLGGGTYLRAAPIWGFNLNEGDHNIPLGIGVGQVIKKGKTVYNFFVEPQFSVSDSGPGNPEWQIYFALNMQFLN